MPILMIKMVERLSKISLVRPSTKAIAERAALMSGMRAVLTWTELRFHEVQEAGRMNEMKVAR